MEQWREMIGEELTVGDVGIGLRVDSVTVHEASHSVEFAGPADRMLDQGTYPLERNGQSWLVFVVPVGYEGDTIRYESVFS